MSRRAMFLNATGTIRWLAAALTIAVLGCVAGPLRAQQPVLPTDEQLRQFGASAADGAKKKPKEATISATILPPHADQPARLRISATVKKGWHIYSITQPAGGPKPAEIILDRSEQFKLGGDFTASPPPKKSFDSEIFKINLETHEGTVVWTAPLKLADGVEPAKLKIAGKVDVQACDENNCVALLLPFTAEVAKPKGNEVDVPSHSIKR